MDSIPILKKWMYFTACITLIVLVLTTCNFAADSPINAKVIDTSGKAYNVTGLYAKYKPGGIWVGSGPTYLISNLSVSLVYLEDDFITTTEKLDLPFSVLKSIEFQNGGSTALITMINDTQIFINSTFFEEKAFNGNLKRFQIRSSEFSSGKVQGQTKLLRGFSGRAMAKSGREGDFYIPLENTSKIEF
jgi:hypothetical protein